MIQRSSLLPNNPNDNKYKKNNLRLLTFKANEKHNSSGTANLTLPTWMVQGIERAARLAKKPVHLWLLDYLPIDKINILEPEPSVTQKIGKTNVTTLIDGKQIFEKTIDFIKNAKSSIQLEMFEFQNMEVDGDIWPSRGAENVKGWEEQQQILDALIQKKKKENVNVQVILDVHKWYKDGNGNKKRHYGNMAMIKKLKENGIDVVPYPRSNQNGTKLQHVKFLAVDSKKVILGGMNAGNHSAANHDACIALETLPKEHHSEVDNLIMEIFATDWAFAWERMAKTNLVKGPLTDYERELYKGLNRQILDENVEYMDYLGEFYKDQNDNPRYHIENEDEDYDLPNGVHIPASLNLPKVKPIEKPDIKILTNFPREYANVGAKGGSESIGNYIRNKLDKCTKLRAELFILSNPEIARMIIKRFKDAKNKKDKPFDVKILVDPGILEDFPYSRKIYNELKDNKVPIMQYRTENKVNQRLHCKWAVFDDKELLIGSANWSSVGLENNLDKGERDDYELSNKAIDDAIYKHKTIIQGRENLFGLKSIYDKEGKVKKDKLKERNREIGSKLKNINEKSGGEISLKNDESKVVKINLTEDNLSELWKLKADYSFVKKLLKRKKAFTRGNHECAVALTNKDIAETFLRQFDKDWGYSERYKEHRLDLSA